MMISLRDRIAFAGAPRCATHSIHHYLARHHAACVVGPGRHSFALPAVARDFYLFTVARNPYTRILSLWLLSQREAWRPEIEGMTFLEFLNWLPEPDTLKELPALSRKYLSISELMDELGRRPDRVLRFERLEEGFAELPFVDPPLVPTDPRLPRLCANPPAGDPREHYSPEAIAVVLRKFKRDFHRFGYHPDDIPGRTP